MELIKLSYIKIFTNYNIIHSKNVLLVLLVSILAKLIIGIYSSRTSKKIDSLTLKALAEDSFSDMLISCVTLISYIVSYYSDLKLDGYMGIIVALFIVYSGVKTMMEISKPLIGARDDVELNKKIKSIILENENISNLHDLQVHTYGNSRIYCSACAILKKDMLVSEIGPELDLIRLKLEDEFANIDVEIGFKYK